MLQPPFCGRHFYKTTFFWIKCAMSLRKRCLSLLSPFGLITREKEDSPLHVSFLSFVFLHTHAQTTTKTKKNDDFDRASCGCGTPQSFCRVWCSRARLKTAAAARFFCVCVGEEEIHTTEFNGGKWSHPLFSHTRECLSLLFHLKP